MKTDVQQDLTTAVLHVVLSAHVECQCSTVILSDSDGDTDLDHSSSPVDVIHDCACSVSPLSALLLMADLAGQNSLLRPSLTDL